MGSLLPDPSSRSRSQGGDDVLRLNRGNEIAGSHWELNLGHLTCAASALPLSYDNWTTTCPHNPLYVLPAFSLPSISPHNI